MKHILDSSFRYTPSFGTDVRRTFERIRRELQSAGAAASEASSQHGISQSLRLGMSDGPAIERRLTAVAFADVAGFSRLMEQNDVRTLQRWKDLRRDLIEPKIVAHCGRLLRVVGDGLFIEFKSVVDAVQWATDVQASIASARSANDASTLQLRIGINVEDVLIDGEERHGDGVNIAARIQQLAQPGDTVVTASVKDHAQNKVDATFVDMGEHHVKNIERRIHIYRVATGGSAAPWPRPARMRLAWDRRPSE